MAVRWLVLIAILLAACGQKAVVLSDAQADVADAPAQIAELTAPPLPPTAAEPEPAPATASPDAVTRPEPQGTAVAPTAPPAEDEPPAATAPRDRDHGAALWGRGFTSVAVTERGRPRPLVGDEPVRVAFELRDHGGGMRWQAACNIAGADLAVGPRRLRVTLQGATSMGCQPDAHEQDDWLAAFFDADPHWLLQDSTLRLHTDEIVIELTETAYW